jgi:Carboxypeptidase regulatory-like domain
MGVSGQKVELFKKGVWSLMTKTLGFPSAVPLHVFLFSKTKCTLLRMLAMATIALFVSANVARADNVYGSIRGTVTDPSGAAVSGAKVTATNTATGISKEATTGSDGTYDFLQLAVPAPYTVSVEQTGFRKFEASGIPLNVNQVYVLDIKLEVGAVTETVTVEATPAQVETTSIELGTVINDTTIVNMPLNGRNFDQLQQLEPGVVAASDSRGGPGHGNYATNGSQPDQNSYLINGTDNNDLPLNEVQVEPSVDAIAEFKMVTGTFNPEYGRNSGAIVNAIIKSGTNSFHGDVFDFYRDTALNSRNFFSPTPAVFHRHQFGGTIGGPIRKNKMFIFFSYQGTRQHRPENSGDCGCGNPGVSPVFTADQRNGIFPDIAASTKSSAFPLIGEDGVSHPAGTPYSTLFPTGHIPTIDFNPISNSLLKFVPAPTVGNLFEFNPVFTQGDDQELGRFDYNVTSKDAF